MAWNGLIKYVSRKRMFWVSIVHGMEWVDKVCTMRTQIIVPLRLLNLVKNSHAYVAYSGAYDY